MIQCNYVYIIIQLTQFHKSKKKQICINIIVNYCHKTKVLHEHGSQAAKLLHILFSLCAVTVDKHDYIANFVKFIQVVECLCL